MKYSFPVGVILSTSRKLSHEELEQLEKEIISAIQARLYHAVYLKQYLKDAGVDEIQIQSARTQVSR